MTACAGFSCKLRALQAKYYTMKIWTNNDLDLGKMRLHSIAQTVSFVIHKIHKKDKYAQCRKASFCKHLNKSANQEKSVFVLCAKFL